MSRQRVAGETNRREFLVLAGGAAIVVPATAHADERTGSPKQSAAPIGERLPTPEWVYGVTRMAFGGFGDLDPAAKAGVQVFHTNLVWPYYPLKRDGGGLSVEDHAKLHDLVDRCHKLGMKLSLGLPPFPPVNLVREHSDWRIHPDDIGSVLKIEPQADSLGTRNPCNLGPWGDYLIEICAELVRDYGGDGYSFDGNYHPPICFCPACKQAYREERSQELPLAANLDDVEYRKYLAWRDEKLIGHYERLRRRIRQENADTALISWTVNAGRYGHLLHSPRAMPTSLNRVFDLPMQEWWLDETNLGASVAPAFGAAYLRATAGCNPAASEAYLMSRGNPYGTDSFPVHERLTRTLLAVTNGCVVAESFGWPGQRQSTLDVFAEIGSRTPWLTRTAPLAWGALLVSEQTRQFYAYKEIAERFLPHVFGAFRMAMEEHLPFALINDWDLAAEELDKFSLLILPNSAAMSDSQVSAVREFVDAGGGVVATGESSLCDELGRPRNDFALADVFGVRYQGRPNAPLIRPELDANFAVAIDESYWQQRIGVGRLTWDEHPLFDDEKLRRLTPNKSVVFRGPQTAVSKPAAAEEVAARLTPEGWKQAPLPAVVARKFGQGKVVYLAASLDAALWSYAYPYQRRLLARAVHWAAREPASISVSAPMCVQAVCYTQDDAKGRRTIVHLFNGLNTTANHGLPSSDVPLREETPPIHGIRVHFRTGNFARFHLEPAGTELAAQRQAEITTVELPPLEIHAILIAEHS